jgi:hypothetical protein
MRKVEFTEDLFTGGGFNPALIHDWYDLALYLSVQPYQLSYLKKNLKAQQRKIELRKDGGKDTRVVFQSSPLLKRVQNRIKAGLLQLDKPVYDPEVVLAYRKGVNAAEIVSQQCDKRYHVHFDIRKFYDYITVENITQTLMDAGFTKLGAQLLASYCVVQRRVPGKSGSDPVKHIRTLQQGSPASPVISNLVGAKYIDTPVLAWVAKMKEAHPEIDFTYLRYSDNALLTLNADPSASIDLEIIKDFKNHVRDALAQHKFYTHKWAVVPKSHPKRNQQFLGIVLNKAARIESGKFEIWRATLFNACRCGLTTTAYNFFEHFGRDELPDPAITSAVDQARFNMVMNGRWAYLKSFSGKQALQLKKLYEASKLLHAQGVHTAEAKTVPADAQEVTGTHWDKKIISEDDTQVSFMRYELPGTLMAQLRKYTKHEESVDDFLARFTAA